MLRVITVGGLSEDTEGHWCDYTDEGWYSDSTFDTSRRAKVFGVSTADMVDCSVHDLKP
jgi:hypothetical protein